MAKIGTLTFIRDNKDIKGRQGDPETKALGVMCVVSSEDGCRIPFTLGYHPTEDASDDTTVELVETCFKEYNLLESFKKMEICFTTDAMLRGAVEKLFKKYNLQDLKSQGIRDA